MMKITKLKVLLLVAFLPMLLKAQTDSTTVSGNFFDMSLEDLLNMDVTVASKTALKPRESPGIVTIISEQEIQSSGARDLMDVLNLVLGFNFGHDVQGM